MADVVFSADETTLTMGGKTLYRPTRPAWRFAPAGGKTYWVSKDGQDSFSGLAGTPWQTIRKAIATARAGDLVYITDGTYQEQMLFDTYSGVLGKPIIFSCAPGSMGKVTVVPSRVLPLNASVADGICQFKTVNYVTVNGLVFKGSMGTANDPGKTGYSECGVSWNNFAAYCTAQNCVAMNALHCGFKTEGGGGIKHQLLGYATLNNGRGITTDHGVYWPDDSSVIDGGINFGNAGWGIHLYTSPSDLTVTRNINWLNHHGILLGCKNSRIWHNVNYRNGRGLGGDGFTYHTGTCTNNDVRNNISVWHINDANRPTASDCNANGTPGTSWPGKNWDDHNLYYPGVVFPGNPPGSPPLYQDNAIGLQYHADPMFMNSEGGDFRLAPGSPGIQAGVDLMGMGSPPDLGAFARVPRSTIDTMAAIGAVDDLRATLAMLAR